VKLVILRGTGPPPPGAQVVLARHTPPIVRTAANQRDYFCLADDPTLDRLSAAGWLVTPVHDGWYDNDTGGGLAVWANARHFELRDTLFTARAP
jgi:hypothetical protein